jgi:uncharacterized protein
VRFLDTNILIRYLTRDDVEKARRSLHLLRLIEQGDEQVATTPLVMFETVFLLHRSYRIPSAAIRDLVRPIIDLPGLRLAEKHLFIRALDIFVDLNIPFADAYNAAFMEQHGFDEIYSWDTDFDKISGIVRIEPDEEPAD